MLKLRTMFRIAYNGDVYKIQSKKYFYIYCFDIGWWVDVDNHNGLGYSPRIRFDTYGDASDALSRCKWEADKIWFEVDDDWAFDNGRR